MLNYALVYLYKAILYVTILMVYILIKVKNVFRPNLNSSRYKKLDDSIRPELHKTIDKQTDLYSFLKKSNKTCNTGTISNLVHSKNILSEVFLDMFQGAGYDYILEEYGIMSKFFWLNYHKRGLLRNESVHLIKNFCTNKTSIKVLDVGCGSCTSLILLHKILKEIGIKFELYGCDIYPKIVVEGIHNLNKTTIHPKLLICNGEHLPYKDNYFDLVINYGGINQFQNISKGLDEMLRVVKSGGLCICRDEHYNSKKLNDFEKFYFNFIKDETVPIEYLNKIKVKNINITYLNNIQFLLSFQHI